MRYPFLIIALFASATLATLDAPAQRVPTPDPVQLVAFQPDKAPKAEDRERGYRPSTPEKKAALRLERARMHDHRMRHLVAASTPPAEYDVKDQGWAGDSGDQSSCGSCYLYSTVKTATSAFVQAGYGKVDVFRLSFQYGMDCHQFGGCNGGNGTEVIDWMVKNGWPAESYDDGTGTIKSDYPAYSARSQQCRLKTDAKKWFPKDWLFITSDQTDKPATVAEYKAALMTYGRVNVALDAGGQFGNYQSGVITSLGRNIDHEINVRGWSDAKQALLLENQWRGWGGAKTPGDNCAWLAYAAVGALQDPFVVSAVPLPPVPPVGNIPVISSPVTASATINQPFTYQIVASNAPTAYAAAGLPDGLTCSATGLIAGVATLPGTFAVGLSATNAKGVGTASLALVVGTTPVPPGPVSQTSVTIVGSTGMDGSYYLVPHALGNMRFIDVVMPKGGPDRSVLPPLVPVDDRWKKQDDFNQSQTQFNREFLEALKDLKKSIKP